MNSSSLELQFSLERLKRFLEHNPETATELAIAYFEDFSNLALEYKQLEQDFQAMQTELTILKQQHQPTRKFSQLPSFLNHL